MQPDATDSARRPHWIADRLDVRLAQRRLGPLQRAGLADALAALHARPAGRLAGGAAVAERAARARGALVACAPALAAPAAACEATVRAGAAALDARAASGRAGALHGGLRCEVIHVDPQGRAALGAPARGAAGDACEDVAALAVQLAARGHSGPARELVACYAEAAGDFALYRVLDPHLALAALVEAERTLATAPATEAARSAAERVLAAPAALAAPARAGVALAVGGGVATGKSTLAALLAEATGAPVASADAARAATREDVGAAASEAAYAEMFARAEHVVAAGRPVVFDACFATRAQRAALRGWAERHGLGLLFVECRADAARVRRRLAARARAQGCDERAWLALRDAVRASWEPVRELPRDRHLAVDTGADPAPALDRIVRALARLEARPRTVRPVSPTGLALAARSGA